MNNAFELTVKCLRNQGLNSDEILDELSRLFQKFSQSLHVAETKSSDEEKIRMLLNRLCMPIGVKGYNCWVEAIQIYKSTNGNVHMGKMYQQVAEKFESTPSRVERAMRFAVECACKKGEKETFYAIFGKNFSSKTGLPKNKQFIAVVSELI